MVLNFIYVSFFVILAILCLVAISLGVIKLIDYLEENPYGSKDMIQNVVYASVALHILFLLSGMSYFQLLFSLSIQYCFNTMFDVYPLIKPEDIRFIYGAIGSLVNYFLMIRFISVQKLSLLTIIPYFIIIWATPICFFFSMSASEDNLFLNKPGIKNKTYAGMAIDWVLKFGKKQEKARY